jgi:hypothetical protein
MPGFVDVGGMTAEQVRRMGHADDYDHETKRFGRVAPPRTNTVLQTGHTVSDVWAAASAAQRVNGGYFKEEQWMQSAVPPYIAKRRNRDVMMDFLHGVETLTDEDREAGEQCRDFLAKDLTFRAIKGQLTDFDRSVQQVLAVKDRFYTVSNRYELAVAASLPSSVDRARQREAVDARTKFAQGGLIGKVGDKVQLQIEVLNVVRSKQFPIFWIRAISDQDQVVSFSHKESFDMGTHLTIQGKVKAHRDNLTQLNYVKVL